jgi:ABC-type polysaccharide/polyol phosphate export permease
VTERRSDAMRRIADVLPLTHVVTSIREAWLGTATVGGHLLALTAWLVAGLAVVAWQVRRRS